MKITLLTAYTNEYAPLAAISNANKALYCGRHGINFVAKQHTEPMDCWERPKFWLEELVKTDWLWWMGCDTLITNMKKYEFNNPEPNVDFIFSCDGNGLQSDVFLMRNCNATKNFLHDIIDSPHPPAHAKNEQEKMCLELSGHLNYASYVQTLKVKCIDLQFGGKPADEHMIATLQKELNNSDVRCQIVPQREFNAYPFAAYGKDPDSQESWQYGDFILHLPGHSLQTRLALFKQHEKLVIK